jgi:Putative Ig domain
LGTSVVCAVAALAAWVAATSAASPVPPKVTIIGDSVMTGVLWHRDAVAVMQKGLGVDWQVAVCRRLEGESCPFEGVQVPTVVELVQSLGPEIAPTVVVEMGYNDFELTFAQSVEDTVRELLDAGVKRILWVNLREVRHPYVDMNGVLDVAANRYPQLTIVDWNRYSRSHPDWFQNDGEHLQAAGGLEMAAFVHAALMKVLAPVAVAAQRLPVAHVGRAYAATLVATGGTMPYRWTLSAGSLPKGLGLTKNGRIVGIPKQPSRASVVVRAMDAVGGIATRRVSLTVER